MTVGVYCFELHLPGSQSLKQKRQVLRRLKDRLRSRHNVALVEDEAYQDKWQRAALTLVSVASNRDVLTRLFEAVREDTETQIPGHFIESGSDFIDLAGGDENWA